MDRELDEAVMRKEVLDAAGERATIRPDRRLRGDCRQKWAEVDLWWEPPRQECGSIVFEKPLARTIPLWQKPIGISAYMLTVVKRRQPVPERHQQRECQEMIVTLTHADLRSIVNFYADQGVKLAPALIARMSEEQREMAAEIYRRAGEMLIARADKLADRLADQRDRRATQG
jgi:hypothetical protein